MDGKPRAIGGNQNCRDHGPEQQGARDMRQKQSALRQRLEIHPLRQRVLQLDRKDPVADDLAHHFVLQLRLGRHSGQMLPGLGRVTVRGVPFDFNVTVTAPFRRLAQTAAKSVWCSTPPTSS